MMAPRRPPDLDIQPILNTDRGRGASPEALRALGLDPDAEDDGEPTGSATKPSGSANTQERAAKKSAAAFGSKGRGARGRKRDDAADDDGPSARRGGRPAKENRVQRAVRLSPAIDAKLHELAETRGIDLNAAVSVAIAEDWRRSCRDGGRGP